MAYFSISTTLVPLLPEEALSDLILKFGRLKWYIKLGAVLALVVLFLMLYTFLVLMPLREEMSKAEQSSVALRSEIQTLKKESAGKAESARRVENIATKVRRAQEQLPEKSEVAKLLQDIAAEANDLGLSVKSFSKKAEVRISSNPNDPLAPVELAEVPSVLSLRGPFHKIAIFLDKLSRKTRIINVDNLAIRAQKDIEVGREILLDAEFNVRTYRFLTDEEQSEEEEKAKQAKQEKSKKSKKKSARKK